MPLFSRYDLFGSLSGINQWPTDLWAAQNNFFLTIYFSSHFTLALAFILLTILMFFLGLQTQKWRYFIIAGLSNMLLFSFHPYHLYSIMAITGSTFIFCWLKNFWRWSLMIIPKMLGYIIFSLPTIIYHYYLIANNSALQQRVSQNICPTPHFVFVFLGYGVWMILAVAGAFLILRIKKLRTEKNLLLVIWLVIQGACLYLPILYPRKLSQGWQLPMFLLSFIFISWLLTNLKIKKTFWFYILLLIFFILTLSNLFNLGRDLAGYYTQNSIFYWQQDYVDLSSFIRQNLGPDSTLVAPKETAKTLPASTGRRVHYGHEHLTLQYQKKYLQVSKYFNQKESLSYFYDYCRHQGISHLVLTPEVPLFNQRLEPWFQLIYSNNSYKLYQLKDNQLPYL